MREIYFYYNKDDGSIIGYSKNENPEFSDNPHIMVPLDDARKFYSGEVMVTDWMVDATNLEKPKLIKKSAYGIASKARVFPSSRYKEITKEADNQDVLITITNKHIVVDKKKKIDVTIFIIDNDDPTLLVDTINLNNRKRSFIINKPEEVENYAFFVRGDDKDNFVFSLVFK